MQKKLQIIHFSSDIWAHNCSLIIQSRICSILKLKNHCSVMLTGGRSAKRLYTAWSKLSEFQNLRNVHFYFTDERCVCYDNVDSNYCMVMNTLFNGIIPESCSVSRIEAEELDFERLHLYSEKLPKTIDVMILGLGDDGHIASIFPRSIVLNEAGYKVVPIIAPIAPHNRVTITPVVVRRAICVFLLAFGSTKSKILQQVFLDFTDFESLPARLVSNGICLTDQNVIIENESV